MNPFGVPITDETLKAMSRYRDETITQEDRTREAVRLIHAEDKNLSALDHALKLKSSYGAGVSTLCLLYNATGCPLELVASQNQNWHGSIYKEEPPRSFQNGQWLAFLHVHAGLEGSKGARVYRGHNIKGVIRDFMFAWSTPPDAVQNSSYTEVRDKDHFPWYRRFIRDDLLKKANKITTDGTDEHCSSTTSIGGITSPELIVVFRHKFSPLK